MTKPARVCPFLVLRSFINRSRSNLKDHKVTPCLKVSPGKLPDLLNHQPIPKRNQNNHHIQNGVFTRRSPRLSLGPGDGGLVGTVGEGATVDEPMVPGSAGVLVSTGGAEGVMELVVVVAVAVVFTD